MDQVTAHAAGYSSLASPLGLPLVTIAGVIKWFDPSKGFGFVLPDDGSADVMLHATSLRRSGHETAIDGARVVVEAAPHPKGRRVWRVVSMDESTAAPTRGPGRVHVVAPTTGLERATCKWFNRLRGFGFFTQAGQPDIFVHAETLQRYGVVDFQPGQEMLVRHGPGPKGRTATEVRPLSYLKS